MEWLHQADLSTRQKLGQFMTPRLIREHLLDQLKIQPGQSVLDPGVGTAEFLLAAHNRQPKAKFYGWDLDGKILEFAKKNAPFAEFSNQSALEYKSDEAFDFVIGNPPYFEMKLEPQVKKKFESVISGRANIYALFFKVALDVLKPGGTLAYVVPPSMNAGAYFKNLRQYINHNGHVSYLKVFHKSDHFVDAQTSVQIIIVKKIASESRYVFHINRNELWPNENIFAEDVEALEEMFAGKRSLTDLGYKAVTGNVVWNQKQDHLSDKESDDFVPLFYARNIRTGSLELEHDTKKKQYVSREYAQSGPAILVNRIIGGVGKGVINAAIVPEGLDFAAENHLNVIKPIAGMPQLVTIEELLAQVRSEKTIEAARLLTGNTQLAASEWNKLIPFV